MHTVDVVRYPMNSVMQGDDIVAIVVKSEERQTGIFGLYGHCVGS